MSRRERINRTNLGLALLLLLREPGERFTLEDIAAWCDCCPEAIQQIESKALKKLKAGLRKQGIDESVLRAFTPDHSADARRTPRRSIV